MNKCVQVKDSEQEECIWIDSSFNVSPWHHCATAYNSIYILFLWLYLSLLIHWLYLTKYCYSLESFVLLNIFKDLLKDFFNGVFTERAWEMQREVFSLLAHSPNSHNDHSWAKPSPAARGFFQISSMSSVAQEREPSSTAFPSHSQVAEVKKVGQNPAPK